MRHSNFDLFFALYYTLIKYKKKICHAVLGLGGPYLCPTVIIIKEILSETCLPLGFISFFGDTV